MGPPPRRYGVLGVQRRRYAAIASVDSPEAPPPDDATCVVDPAGLEYVQRVGPRGAGGAAGAIDDELGIRHRTVTGEW